MGILSDIQNKLRQSGFWIVCLLLFVYFGFHSVNGDRGILKYLYLKNEIVSAKKIKNDYGQQRNKLEEKVKLLSNSSLDLDLLEERARAVLNLAGKDEFIILDIEEKD